jgi:hypothetical protein
MYAQPLFFGCDLSEAFERAMGMDRVHITRHKVGWNLDLVQACSFVLLVMDKGQQSSPNDFSRQLVTQ